MIYKIEKHPTKGFYSVTEIRIGSETAMFPLASDAVDHALAIAGAEEKIEITADVLYDYRAEWNEKHHELQQANDDLRGVS